MKILYVPLEYAKWKTAQYWSYPEGLGLEEGFAGCGVECFVLTGLIQTHYYASESFLDHARRLYAKTRFDAVWLTIPHIGYDPDFLEWLKKIGAGAGRLFRRKHGTLLGRKSHGGFRAQTEKRAGLAPVSHPCLGLG